MAMRALSPAARAHVRAAAAAGALGEEIVEFVDAVALLVAHPLGGATAREGAFELSTADRVLRLLERSLGGEAVVTDAAGELAAEPEMLAAFFQNLDLLPAGGHPAADAIPLLVVLALSRLEEMGRPSGM